jgi:hypothetical protein
VTSLSTSKTLLVTDFVNLKIKPAQSFRDAYKGRMCVRVFIGVSARRYMNIYTMFLKRKVKAQKGHDFIYKPV